MSAIVDVVVHRRHPLRLVPRKRAPTSARSAPPTHRQRTHSGLHSRHADRIGDERIDVVGAGVDEDRTVGHFVISDTRSLKLAVTERGGVLVGDGAVRGRRAPGRHADAAVGLGGHARLAPPAAAWRRDPGGRRPRRVPGPRRPRTSPRHVRSVRPARVHAGGGPWPRRGHRAGGDAVAEHVQGGDDPFGVADQLLQGERFGSGGHCGRGVAAGDGDLRDLREGDAQDVAVTGAAGVLDTGRGDRRPPRGRRGRTGCGRAARCTPPVPNGRPACRAGAIASRWASSDRSWLPSAHSATAAALRPYAVPASSHARAISAAR